MNDLLKIVLLLGIGGVVLYFVYEIIDSSGLGSNSDSSTTSEDDTPGGGPYAGGCGYPIVCDASGQPTGQETPLGTGTS